MTNKKGWFESTCSTCEDEGAADQVLLVLGEWCYKLSKEIAEKLEKLKRNDPKNHGISKPLRSQNPAINPSFLEGPMILRGNEMC